MKLELLLDGIDYTVIQGSLSVSVTDLSRDSREIEPGWLFFAEQGESVDGHEFIDHAVAQGARVIIWEKKIPTYHDGITYIMIPALKKHIGMIAHRFFGNPTHELHVIAVTGTNGKTSVATLTAEALEYVGHRVAVFGTIENKIAGTVIPATHTTPQSIALARLCRQAVDAGCTYVCMEASSHALVQGRLDGMRIMTSIFTNLTQDHLDYHKTMEAYAEAKQILFSMTHRDGYCIINADDPYASTMVLRAEAAVVRVSTQGAGDIVATEIHTSHEGISAIINQYSVTFPILGMFNFLNRLLVIATLLTLEISIPHSCEALQKCSQPRGRFEVIKKNSRTVIIDYAHTPDAVEKVLQTIQSIPDHNRIITLIGCGGNRDTSKRPLMGRIASDYSDLVIFTSDNPRDEDPQKIIDDMLTTLTKDNYKIIIDRKDAIYDALVHAHAGDIVAILGKGHETYQEIKGSKHHCDDREEVERFFNTHH
jgi:UDP-N-acetylmuramoyl-L-alanyl-D-glutamate--2,6-diaminopimelate ligase